MTRPMGDWMTELANLVLERLDRVVDALERIADAQEGDDT